MSFWLWWWYAVRCSRSAARRSSWRRKNGSGISPYHRRMWHRWPSRRPVWTCSSRRFPSLCISSLCGQKLYCLWSPPRTLPRFRPSSNLRAWTNQSYGFYSGQLPAFSDCWHSICRAWPTEDPACTPSILSCFGCFRFTAGPRIPSAAGPMKTDF